MDITGRIQQIQQDMATIGANSPLVHPKLRLMGASKAQSTEAIEAAIASGLTVFGENKVQEAYSKWPEIKKIRSDTELHLIGPLQSNKTKDALALFDVIETLDRPKLAKEIAKLIGQQDCVTKAFYVQVNIGDEDQKSGVSVKEADDFIVYCKEELALPVTGLMCVPPADAPPAPYFALLKKIADRRDLTELSMGMSEDYKEAIRMGSSCIRLGTAIFGPRI